MNKEEEKYKEKLRKEEVKMSFIFLAVFLFGGLMIVFFATEGDIKLTFLLMTFSSVVYGLLMYFYYKTMWEK